ncbi:MAG: SDR family oxidoreductase [Bacteroidetes bacterium]|nr:SDR family oxidoreductase [Bacteroidota bacterium]MBU1373596.1 SDR family oxidoreductase [Bacteroidota bacterium]MBU1486407.1 SDR family oxidoreductase [Bacteroidota bacterium]MBU1759980.1 SDR family oxidoreductase [Bacteroidota bacterium]MBU2045615.1 SDR family oxidoreductase [Bacteroidota bacterium]
MTSIADQFSLKGKVIVVTGGTGILGESFVKSISSAGGKVVILGRKADVAEARAKEINENGGDALAVVADVLDEESLIKAKDLILEKYGKIDGLVNGAGGNMSGAVVEPDASVFNLDMASLEKVMNLNLFGTIKPTQIFGQEIAKTGKGSIVNISSMSAQKVITKVLGYSIAKIAIDGYTKWFAVELANRYGDQIRMNAIAPGFFLTEQNRNLLTNPDGSFKERGQLVVKQTPFNRFGTPDELEGALIYLLSDASKFVTGTIINVDGGFATFSGV